MLVGVQPSCCDTAGYSNLLFVVATFRWILALMRDPRGHFKRKPLNDLYSNSEISSSDTTTLFAN